MTEKNVKKILIESGWISNYYYVVKVMQSCANKNSNLNPMLRNISLHKAFWWGKKLLKDSIDNIISKHNRLAIPINEIYKEYESSLWLEMAKVEDKIGILLAEEIETNSKKEQ